MSSKNSLSLVCLSFLAAVGSAASNAHADFLLCASPQSVQVLNPGALSSYNITPERACGNMGGALYRVNESSEVDSKVQTIQNAQSDQSAIMKKFADRVSNLENQSNKENLRAMIRQMIRQELAQ